MRLAGIHHVSLNVADTATSVEFYRDVLGMAELPRPDLGFPGAWLDAGDGQQIHLIEGTVPPAHGQHVAFEVDDVAAAIAALRAKGVAVGDAKTVGDSDVLQTFVRDPDGNLLELTQPPR